MLKDGVKPVFKVIQAKIEKERYSSIYQLDLDVADALNSFHDGHMSYSTLYNSIFIFVHEHPFNSLSKTPDTDSVTCLGDAAINGPVEGGEASKINGQEPKVYLKQLAESQPW